MSITQVAGPDDAFLRRIVLGLGLTHDGQAQAGIHFGGDAWSETMSSTCQEEATAPCHPR